MNDLKLYVWDDVLANQSSGVCFALANSKADAIESIVQKRISECKEASNNYSSNDECEKCNSSFCHARPYEIREELEGKDPKITDDKYGFFLEGSD